MLIHGRTVRRKKKITELVNYCVKGDSGSAIHIYLCQIRSASPLVQDTVNGWTWRLTAINPLNRGPWLGQSLGRCLCIIEILTKTRKMPSENQLGHQILLQHPRGSFWAMLWITAANGRGRKASFRRLITGTLD